MSRQQLVVIGNGMAGMRTVEELLLSAPDRYQITVFGAEPYGNYNRIMLSAVLAGDKAVEDIVINDRQWYRDHDITLHVGPDKAVVRIERGLRKVVAQDGTVADYDRLLIATGSKPVMPELTGAELAGVIGFRDIVDVNTMLDYSRTRRHAVVIGGGLLGLEAASGLAQRGMAVTVIHNHPSLLNRQLDSDAAELLRQAMAQRGIAFRMPARLQALLDDGSGHVGGVRFDDGSELDCDLVVVAIGVKPNIALARGAGLYCERGIVVNDTLQTYDPSVYAVGECIQHRGATFGLVAPLFEQAKVCANHLSAHGMAEYVTLPTATQLKVSGIRLFSVGDFLGNDDTSVIRFNDPAAGVYKKLVLKDNRIQGAVLFGDTADGRWYQQLLEQQQDIAAMRSTLIFGRAVCEAPESAAA